MQDHIEIINTCHGAYVLIVRYARISGLDVDEAASELLEKLVYTEAKNSEANEIEKVAGY